MLSSKGVRPADSLAHCFRESVSNIEITTKSDITWPMNGQMFAFQEAGSMYLVGEEAIH